VFHRMMAPPTRTTARNTATAELTADQKLDLLLNDMAEIKNNNIKFSSDIAEIKQDIKDFKSDVDKSIEFCSAQISDCLAALEDHKNKLAKCENTIEQLSSENKSLKKQLIDMKNAEVAAEQYSRSNCLEIRGVPEEKQENIVAVVKNVAKTLNFSLEESMIDAVHRLSKNPNDPTAHRGIIIKFCRRLDMEEMRRRSRIKNGFSAAELGYESESKVFVNLSLTRETRALWQETRAFKARMGYKYAWITNAGKVFLRREEGARAVRIATKSDLELLK
jgi:hypothetical protein